MASPATPASEEVVVNFHYTNNFSRWPAFWPYPDYRHIYCTGNYTIPGQRDYLAGALFITQYLFYLIIYIPALIVIARKPLIDHACYKIMLAIGIIDNCFGTYITFTAGLFSIFGVNYCDNTRLLVISGHLGHSLWMCYCMSSVVLAFDRLLELKSANWSMRLFGEWRAWVWMAVPITYGAIGMTTWDLPAIYNSVYGVFMFQIDMRDGAPLIHNWVCHMNSLWTMTSLVVIYTLLILELRKTTRVVISHSSDSSTAKQITRKQRRVLLQCTIICIFIFNVSATYALFGFFAIPLWLTRSCTTALQLGCGCTSIVYLVFNETIRRGVKELLLGRCLGVVRDNKVGATGVPGAGVSGVNGAALNHHRPSRSGYAGDSPSYVSQQKQHLRPSTPRYGGDNGRASQAF